ncbi:Spy/CpxP family protein refolding chaperone [Geomesophilobacter sediminis]|uniref:Spy/CpxP family protein refolding chaperone n=1 Tax=Geomesophilobacter sediminis TaxID=2798584 RepID=A0A8J7LVF4_9BACT|nr:Spy/CpxP family protein refolding chaperone [Geomesophilobacter sediminis]MBJ6724960.1 Spy/CpxP family protein refolding chaperone [Geomesophilobacter sediminis]
MKKQLAVFFATAVITGSAVLAYAFDGPPPKDGGPNPQMMARVLDLTTDQQTQIQALLQAERDQDAALLQQARDLRQQIRTAEHADTFDAAAVRALATTLSQVEIELTVSRATVFAKVNALLTPAQRALAQKLEPPQGPPPAQPPL